MSELLKSILEADKRMKDEKKDMDETIHMSCLGLLCEKLDVIHYQRSKPKVTLRPNEVTCDKCIKILKEQKILK